MIVGIVFIIIGIILFFQAKKQIRIAKELKNNIYNDFEDFKEYQEFKKELEDKF